MSKKGTIQKRNMGAALKLAVALALGFSIAGLQGAETYESALVFYAPFDNGPDAKVAKGDPKLYNAPKIAFPPMAQAGLPTNEYVTIEKGKGKFGDGLRFHRKTSEMIFFHAKNNFPYNTSNMSGTVSFWLKLNPDKELEPGYTDPIQITSKSWDNASFFVEFSRDEKPREFRLGVYADYEIWNPQKRDWNAIPFREKPLLPVIHPPFNAEEWTHVVFAFKNFNSGKPDGVARLFLNGKDQGTISPRNQRFTWDQEKSLIMLGLSYIGAWDELAIFDRDLTGEEVKKLYEAKGPLK